MIIKSKKKTRKIRKSAIKNKRSRNKTKKIITKKNKMSKKPKKKNGAIFFEDYPDFRPNLTPRQMFKLGSFGGTYWRPIKSKFFSTELRNIHKRYPASWWKGIPDNH